LGEAYAVSELCILELQRFGPRMPSIWGEGPSMFAAAHQAAMPNTQSLAVPQLLMKFGGQ
jgi:hypothetical protein